MKNVDSVRPNEEKKKLCSRIFISITIIFFSLLRGSGCNTFYSIFPLRLLSLAHSLFSSSLTLRSPTVSQQMILPPKMSHPRHLPAFLLLQHDSSFHSTFMKINDALTTKKKTCQNVICIYN